MANVFVRVVQSFDVFCYLRIVHLAPPHCEGIASLSKFVMQEGIPANCVH